MGIERPYDLVVGLERSYKSREENREGRRSLVEEKEKARKPTLTPNQPIERTPPCCALRCPSLAMLGVTMPSRYDLNIFADYFQFVLMDESASDDFSTIWTDEALSRMLATGELAVCPGTLRNVEVQVEIVIWESEPSVNLDDHDHAVEASFKIPSGKLMVTSCTGYGPAAPRFSVSPGAYRMLFVVSGVETIQNEWEPADDKYTVHLWPGTSREPRLLKHWKRRDA